MAKAQYTGYWIFTHDPKEWENEGGKPIEQLLEKNYGEFKVKQGKAFQRGQKGIILVSSDTRSKKELGGRKKLEPGIYAIAETLDVAEDVTKNDERKKYIVPIHFLKNLFHSPLLKSEYESHGIILPRNYGGSSIQFEKNVFEEIEKLIKNKEQKLETLKTNSSESLINLHEKIKRLEEKYIDAVPKIKEVISRIIERGEISSYVKELYGFKCKICEALGQNPFSFKKINGEFYVETHHIYPVSKLAKGSLGISNLITVCANHHRQVHYGNMKIENNTGSLIIIIDGQKTTVEK